MKLIAKIYNYGDFEEWLRVLSQATVTDLSDDMLFIYAVNKQGQTEFKLAEMSLTTKCTDDSKKIL